MNPPPSTIVIGIASNYSPEQNTRAALRTITNLFPNAIFSDFLTTKSLYDDGPDYLNAMATATTTLSPDAVRLALKQIERNLGRQKLDKQRIAIDLDLLAYGNLVSQQFRLPRKELFTRPFNRQLAIQLRCLPVSLENSAFD